MVEMERAPIVPVVRDPRRRVYEGLAREAVADRVPDEARVILRLDEHGTTPPRNLVADSGLSEDRQCLLEVYEVGFSVAGGDDRAGETASGIVHDGRRAAGGLAAARYEGLVEPLEGRSPDQRAEVPGLLGRPANEPLREEPVCVGASYSCAVER